MEVTLLPGRLPDLMSNIRLSSDSELILKGSASASDLTALRQLPLTVKKLDMSELSITGCELNGSNWFGVKSFKDGEIPPYMLLATGVVSIQLPADVKVIGKGAFSSTPLTEIKCAGIERIGESAFLNCKELKKVDFAGSSFTTLPAYIFSGCTNLREAILPSGIVHVENHAFEKSGVERVNLPAATGIGDYAFAFTPNLSEISYSNGCVMGEGAFYGTSSLETIIGSAENSPALYSASGGSQDIIIVNSPEVGDGAYSRSNSTVITLGKDVAKIGPYAFHSMPNLQRVVASACTDIPEADSNAFAGNNVSEIPLFVKRGEVERWRNAPVWQDFRITDEESGVNDTLSINSDVMITRSGDLILVESSGNIHDVKVYSTDGKMLASVNSASGSVELPFPAGYDIVIVKTSGEYGIKVSKLMK